MFVKIDYLHSCWTKEKIDSMKKNVRPEDFVYACRFCGSDNYTKEITIHKEARFTYHICETCGEIIRPFDCLIFYKTVKGNILNSRQIQRLLSPNDKYYQAEDYLVLYGDSEISDKIAWNE